MNPNIKCMFALETNALESRELESIRRPSLRTVHVVSEGKNDLQNLHSQKLVGVHFAKT